MRVSLLLLVALAVGGAYGGDCPKYPIIRDFDFHRYMGMWYQQDKMQASWEAPGRCWKTLYSRDRKNGQFKMRMIFKSTITGRVEEYDSQLTLQGPAKPSLIKYTIPLTFMEDEFQVLATDYESFSLEWKCDPNGILEKTESIWLLTREKNPSPLALQKAYTIMHHLGIDIRKLERVDQTCGGIELGPAAGPVPLPGDYDYYYPADTPDPSQNDASRRQENPNYYYYEDYSLDDYQPGEGSRIVTASDLKKPQIVVAQPMHSAPHSSHSAAHSSHSAAQSSSPSNHFSVSYPPRSTDTNIRRRTQPVRRGPNMRRQQVPKDDRITLGQTLATRLWHVLHTPISK